LPDSCDERRKYKRADVRIKVEYTVKDFLPQVIQRNKLHLTYQAETTNISEAGMQLLADSAPVPGQIVRLAFSPAEEEKRIMAFAKVKWAGYDPEIRKFRTGMEFYYLNENDKNRLRALIN
jgi:c-di-GMP-binding flagellar brake protein YcgR